MNKQVSRSHYKFKEYTNLARWISYFYQIKEILNLNQSSILEIGSGSDFLKNILIEQGLNYYSCDIADDLKPDYLQNVSDMKINRTFNIVCAFQVLEHLPFNLFEKSLLSMKAHSDKYVLISLPRYGPKFRLFFKIPLMKLISVGFKLPGFKKFSFNGEHYWELGTPGSRRFQVEKIIKRHFKILKGYTIEQNDHQRMYVLEKK